MDMTEWRKADSDRPLTSEGVRKMKKEARGLKHLDLKVDWILTSPYRRAYDTAMIVAKELKLKKNLKATRLLASDGDPKGLVRHLGLHFRSWESVMLVGHEPYLSRLISVLVTGTPHAAIELDKGGLVKLSTDSLSYDRSATLQWLLTSKILKNLV